MTGIPLDPFGLGSLAASLALGGLVMALALAQFVVPIWALARNQTEREPFAPRAAITLVVLYLLNIAAGSATFGTAEGSPARYLCNFFNYSTLLVAFVPAVLACWETSVWNALFCVTAGYTLQNLGSGLGELARIGVETAVGHSLGLGGSIIISNIACAAVPLACWRPFVVRVARMRRLGSETREMLGMLALVIVVVIAYDVVIRGLETHGVAPGFLAVLRLVHAAVCAFVLYAEYQMLYNARLQAEVATAEAISAERVRQYELSRDTIAAVNRRVHDIRHTVLRELSRDDVQVDRATLAEVARDIDVYGAQVRTGNEVLDTLLTEKALLAAQRGVMLSCIADGSAVAHVDAPSLYGLVGGVLDVALAETGTAREGTGSISLTLRPVGSLAALHVEYRSGGASASRAADLTQARAIAEQLGGSLAMRTGTGAHTVDALIPMPG